MESLVIALTLVLFLHVIRIKAFYVEFWVFLAQRQTLNSIDDPPLTATSFLD
jgi:hypothetical protein